MGRELRGGPAGSNGMNRNLTQLGQNPLLIRENLVELSLIAQQSVQLGLVCFNPSLVREDPSLVGEDLPLIRYGRRTGHPILLIDPQR